MTNTVYRLVSILVFSVALNNYTGQMILRRPRKSWERGQGAPRFSGNIHRAFWRKFVSGQCCQCLSCWREKWLIVKLFKSTKKSNTRYVISHWIGITLKIFSYVAHHEVVMFYYFAKSLTFYLYICISWKRSLLIVVVSNNKLFNRLAHDVVAWDIYLHHHSFIYSVFCIYSSFLYWLIFLSSPWIPCLEIVSNFLSNSTSAMVFLNSFYVLYLMIENVSLAIQCFILIATVFNIVSQTILGLCLPAASLYNNKI